MEKVDVEDLIDNRMLAKMLGIAPGSLTQYRSRGLLPRPNYIIGGAYFYLPETVEAHLSSEPWAAVLRSRAQRAKKGTGG